MAITPMSLAPIRSFPLYLSWYSVIDMEHLRFCLYVCMYISNQLTPLFHEAAYI